MEKFKKHSGTQTDTEPSMVSQVPPDKMDLFVEMLNELVQRKMSGKPDSQQKKG